MRNLLPFAFAALLVAAPIFAHGADGWSVNWHEAQKAAAKKGKPILINFTGSDWCGWCVKLKKEVFETPEFKKWAKANVVLLEVDFPKMKKFNEARTKHNRALAEYYEVRGFPAVFFVDAEGGILGKMGYMEGGATAWIKMAGDQLKARRQ